jgi:tetratricopeptide (TPR) repeat protein
MSRRGTVDMGKLYEKLLTLLYEQQDVLRARPVADRLAGLLARFNPSPESIFVEECRSLVCEARGDLPCAIKHRENQIQLIRQLHEGMEGTEHEDYILGQYDYEDLSLALRLLAMLYHESGDLEKAVQTLDESLQVGAEHGIEFDADDLLEEYRAEKNATPRRNAVHSRPKPAPKSAKRRPRGAGKSVTKKR